MFFHEVVEQEIHVEKIDKTYAQLLKWCKVYPEAYLMLCVNLPSKHHCSSNVADFYVKLKRLSNPIGLHMHLATYPEINVKSYDWQYEAIRNGRDFLNSLGIEVRDFAAGWWSYNEDTVKACVALGLHRFHVLLWFLKKRPVFPLEDLTIVKVNHSNHDYMVKTR